MGQMKAVVTFKEGSIPGKEAAERFADLCRKTFPGARILGGNPSGWEVLLDSFGMTVEEVQKRVAGVLCLIFGNCRAIEIQVSVLPDGSGVDALLREGKPERKDPTPEEMLNSLIGAEDLKHLIEEIRMLAPHIIARKTYEAFAFQNYLFAINDGCGLTTCLNLLARLLAELKLFQFRSGASVVEERLPSPEQERVDPFAAVRAQLQSHAGEGGILLCIDISEWMAELSDRRFRNFLLFLEDYTENNIIVFRIPFVEADVLDGISASLQDILFVRPLSFPPMDMDELTECAKRFLPKFGFSADEEVWPVFRARVMEEKSDGRFYGVNTVNKIVREMVYRKQLSDARKGVDNARIRAEDILSLAKSYTSAPRDGMAELSEMVGMETVRRNLEEILTQIELASRHRSIGHPCIHMRFVGNPGTGKTTVARIVGRILKERGVLRNGSFFEYAGRDFCGRYVGETAPKTASMCRDAYGSVLFIDEAYALYRGEEAGRDFGQEALDTLISEMENHRNDLVVIMAGYPEEMARLMQSNPGLESRMPYVIEFPNYTREQLIRIFFRMVGDLNCADGFETAVSDYFNALPDEVLTSKTFSNARFVRNLFERTCGKASVRQKIEKLPIFQLTADDFRLAGAERSFEYLLEKRNRNRIGF